MEALILETYKRGIIYDEAVREFKRCFIITVLEENRGNLCKAARQLGFHRNTLSRTISELQVDVGVIRRAAKKSPASEGRMKSVGR